MGDNLPETEQINELGSGYSRWVVNQQGPQSSGEGLLPAGPEAEITFCCAETAGAVSRLQPAVSLCVPPSMPLGMVSVLGRHCWGEAGSLLQGGEVAQSSHRPSFAGSAPSVLHNLWPSRGRWYKRSRRASIDHQDLLPPTRVKDLIVTTCLCSTKWLLLLAGLSFLLSQT